MWDVIDPNYKKTLQFEIDSFFDLIHSDVSMTKQAFSQARQKISHEPFKRLFDTTVQLGRSEDGMDTFKGLHVSAIDGTTIALEKGTRFAT